MTTRGRGWGFASFCAISLTFSLVPVAAQDPPAAAPPGAAPVADEQVAALLAAPPTPGTLALLVPHASRADAQVRLRESISSRDPAVRRAAARVMHALGLASSIPFLRRTLATEEDPGAAEEQARALVTLGQPADVQAALDAAKRLGGNMPAIVAVAMAAAHPNALVERAGELATFVDARSLGSALARASTSFVEAGQQQATASAAIAVGPAAWESLLALAAEHDLPLKASWLAAALADGSPAVTTAFAWHVASRVATGEAEASALAPEFRRWLDAAGRPVVVERYALTLADRARGLAVPDAAIPEDAAETTAVARALRAHALASFATPAEKAAIHEVSGEESPWSGAADVAAMLAVSREMAGARRARRLVARSAGPFPEGFVSALMDAASCPVNGEFPIADVSYKPDGRPLTIDLVTSPNLPVSCQTAFQAMATTALLPPGVPPRMQYRIVAVAGGDAMECPLPAAVAARDAQAVGRAVQPPEKVHDHRPEYPPEAASSGVGGAVVLSALVSPEGCVGDAEVVKGVPPLDVAAVGAVRRWRYSPTVLDATAVPVRMTVTVNFQPR